MNYPNFQKQCPFIISKKNFAHSKIIWTILYLLPPFLCLWNNNGSYLYTFQSPNMCGYIPKVSILHFFVDAGFVWKPFYRRTCSNTLFGFQVCGHNICTGHNRAIAYLNLVLDREDEGTQLRILSFAKISSFWPPDISAKSLILKFIKDNAS